MVVQEPGALEMVFKGKSGKEQRMEVYKFEGKGGVAMSMYNID